MTTLTEAALLRQFIAEALDQEDEINELVREPEYKSVGAFTEFKFDDDSESFTDVELNALAANVYKMESPGHAQLKALRSELEGYGLKFTPRAAVRSVRGVTSNPNGRHPFAGSGGGGSGLSGGFTSFGGGPGAMGGVKDWSPRAMGSLPMGSRRR